MMLIAQSGNRSVLYTTQGHYMFHNNEAFHVNLVQHPQ